MAMSSCVSARDDNDNWQGEMQSACCFEQFVLLHYAERNWVSISFGNACTTLFIVPMGIQFTKKYGNESSAPRLFLFFLVFFLIFALPTL